MGVGPVPFVDSRSNPDNYPGYHRRNFSFQRLSHSLMKRLETHAENLAASLSKFVGNYPGSPYKAEAESSLREYFRWIERGGMYEEMGGTAKEVEDRVRWFLEESQGECFSVQAAEIRRIFEVFSQKCTTIERKRLADTLIGILDASEVKV